MTKERRIFETYKKDLERLGKQYGQIRFITIEYLCNFPKINPYEMARELMNYGYIIVYDDSTITKKENEQKKKIVEKSA